jgi:MoaA/NifB/PqqE/SkfB family radical SAM enzyme
MQIEVTERCTVRPHIGVRRIGNALCLVNQKRAEVWVSEGISPVLWEKIVQGITPDEIISSVTERYRVPRPTVERDVLNFLEQLWQRQIIELTGREEITEAARAAMVTAPAHHRNGYMEAKAAQHQVICSCVLDLLVPCNLRCRHCYVDFSYKEILPFAEACDYLEQLASHGCPEVSLTGGEVSLRHDLIEIVAHAESLGFLLHVLTNGTLMTPDLAEQLSRYHLASIQLSLYGITAPVHERITQKPGSFEKTVRGARQLIERGARVKFLYFIQRDNFDDAFRVGDFARALGADYGFDTKLVANRNGSIGPLNYEITPAQLAELYRTGLRTPELAFHCSAATATARITADGNVFPCALINSQVLGSLKKQTLAEIWASERRQALRDAILNYRPERCRTCCLLEQCPPCAAMKGFDQRSETHTAGQFSAAGCRMAIANHKFAGATRSTAVRPKQDN